MPKDRNPAARRNLWATLWHRTCRCQDVEAEREALHKRLCAVQAALSAYEESLYSDPVAALAAVREAAGPRPW